MQDFEKLMLAQMRDIQGLNSVSIYPLANGYWFFIFLGFLFLLYLFALFLKDRRYKKSWKYLLLVELKSLERKFRKQPVKQSLSEFSEILKRVSIKLYDRREVASLTGKKWLKWLTLRDPNGFDWKDKGEILTLYPYMPEDKIDVKRREVIHLIRALKTWLEK